jgi:hypothetical protein
MMKGSKQVRALAGEGGLQFEKLGSEMSRVLKNDRLPLAAGKVM